MKTSKAFARFRLAILIFACLLNVTQSSFAHAVNANSNQEAADLDRTYRETNDVLYYDHSCSSSGSSSSGSGDAGGCGNKANNDSANEKQAWDYLVKQFQSKGYSQDEAQKAAAGIMGNWLQESGFNPARNDGMGCKTSAAYGLAQWCGGRINKVKDYTSSHGKPADCLSAELEYAWSEIEGFGLPAQMKGKTPAEAARTFDKTFEGSDGSGARDQKAEDEYKKMTGQSAPSGSTTAASSTSSSSSSAQTASCPSNVATDNGECKNPFRDLKNSGPLRWDGGVDYGGAGGSGPVYAACPGEVVHMTQGSGGWGATPGLYLAYKVTSGKAKDKFIYIAEDCTPKVKVGDKVDSNTVLCDYKQASYYLETGWGAGNGGYVDWSDYNAHGGGSYASNAGQDFGKFLKSIGGQDGHPDPGGASGISTAGHPPGWPDWTSSSSVNA